MQNAFTVPTLIALMTVPMAGVEAHKGPAWDFSHGPLRVDAARRGLEHTDGTPFLWIGDTAWELFHRLDREDVERYLEKRRSQGFTVVQAVALAELDGLNKPNAYNARPLVDNDPTRLWVTPGRDPSDPKEYDYWDHVDYVFDVAASKGIAIALLPTWGDKVPKTGPAPGWGTGPAVFTPDNAFAYGQAIARRYYDRTNLIWVNGGDRAGDLNLEVWHALAAGIREVDRGRHLMTYHPSGGQSSRQWFSQAPWHDFVMLQTGHHRDTSVWDSISTEWFASPTLPMINGEPTYEAIPFGFKVENGFATDHDTRKNAYWSLFSGACGHTYGCHPVWQFYAPGRDLVLDGKPYLYWKSVAGQPGAVDLPGAWGMLHLRRLLLSRPFSERVPDQSLLAKNGSVPAEHQVAIRGEGSDWAMVYTPAGLPINVDLARLKASSLRAWWFDPRHGTSQEINLKHGANDAFPVTQFIPPSVDINVRQQGQPIGNDWILVLDDPMRNFSAPGVVESR